MVRFKFDKRFRNLLTNNTIHFVKKTFFDKPHIQLTINKLIAPSIDKINNVLIYSHLPSNTKYKSLYNKSEDSKYLRRRWRF